MTKYTAVIQVYNGTEVQSEFEISFSADSPKFVQIHKEINNDEDIRRDTDWVQRINLAVHQHVRDNLLHAPHRKTQIVII